MLTNLLKIIAATLLIFTAIMVHAGVTQEIIDGCGEDPLVSSSCILVSPFYTTTIIVVVPSEWSGTGWGVKKAKIIFQAKNDAATFVATNGQFKGSYLEAAFILLRSENKAYQQVSDFALARAILAFDKPTDIKNK